MVDQIPNFLIDPSEAVRMSDRPTSGTPPLLTPQPNNIVLFELGIEAKPGNSERDITLAYRNYAQVTGVTSHADFLGKMSAIIQSSGPGGSRPPRRERDTHASNGNLRTKDTRLSLKWDKTKLSYIVIKLDSNRNWQFSSRQFPFMMHSSDASRSRFFEATRFAPDGTPVPDQGSGSNATPNNRDGCQYAYFIANGPVMGAATSAEFQHRFNIHIEILEMDSNNDIDSRIPIIIDPDVRNPGGSGG